MIYFIWRVKNYMTAVKSKFFWNVIVTLSKVNWRYLLMSSICKMVCNFILNFNVTRNYNQRNSISNLILNIVSCVLP